MPPGRTLECAVDIVFSNKQSMLQIQTNESNRLKGPNNRFNPLDISVHYDVSASAPASSANVTRCYTSPVDVFWWVLMLKQKSWMNKMFFFKQENPSRNVFNCFSLKALNVTTASGLIGCIWMCFTHEAFGGFSSLKICCSFILHSWSRAILLSIWSTSVMFFDSMNQIPSRICLFWLPIFRLNGGREAVVSLCLCDAYCRRDLRTPKCCSSCKIFDNGQKPGPLSSQDQPLEQGPSCPVTLASFMRSFWKFLALFPF